MPESDYNFTAYARAIGVKARELARLTFLDGVRPVVTVADFSSLSPAHQPPVATFGFTSNAAAGERAKFEVQSLGVGGCFVVDFRWAASLLSSAKFRISGVTAGLGTTSVGQVWSNQNVASIVTNARSVAQLLAAGTFPVVNASQFPLGAWLPRGQFLYVEAISPNVTVDVSITIADVPVGEGGDGLPPAP